MSNVNSPNGMTPVKQGAGGVLRPNNAADYAIANGYDDAIYTGDPVAPTGTGNEIELVAAGENPILGSFAGCNYVDANGDTQFRPYWAASQATQSGTVAEASVFDDPNTLYDIQVSGSAGLVDTNIGNTTNWLAGSPQGSSLTGKSAGQLNQADFSDSSTEQQFQVLQLRNLIGNSYGQYAHALASIFLHYRGPVAGGAVVY